MADKVSYNDQFNDDLLEGIKKLQVESEKLFKIYKDAAVSLSKYNAAQKGANDSNKKLAAAEKKLEAQEAKLLKAKERLTIQYQKDLRIQRDTVKQLRQLDIITNKLTGTEEKAAARVKFLTDARKRLNKATENGRKRAEAYTRAINKQNEILKQNLSTEQQRIGGIGRYAKGVLNAAKSMAVMYLGLQGIQALFRNVTGIAIGFEKSMSGVKAISGATDQEFKKLRDSAIQLGSETSKTATEIAGLQKEYALIGFSTQEILDATEATILLSQATGEDLTRSAEIAGATVRGLGLEATDTQRVVDVMAASFTSSALNLERYGESMKYIAPAAKATGLSLEFVTANLAKLADAGIHGSMAGTSMRKILIEMADAGYEGEEAFGKFISNVDSLSDASDAVGKRAATAALILSDQKDVVNELTGAYDNAAGSAEEMAEVQMDNLAGSITLLSSAWEGFIIEMTTGGGVIRSVVDSLTSMFRWMNDNAAAIKLIAKVVFNLTVAWGAYKTVLFLTNTQLGLFVKKLFAQKIALVATTTATKATTTATKAMGAAMALNPLGALITALMIALPLIDHLQTSMAAIVDIADGINAATKFIGIESEARIEIAIINGKTRIEAVQDEIKVLQNDLQTFGNVAKIQNEKYAKASVEKQKEMD